MTPAAMTPDARRATEKRKRAQSPAPPRRVSGPVRGRSTATTSSPAPAVAPTRRPSGQAAAARAPRSASTRMLAGLGSLPDHPLLDRLVRGRAWILVLGVMLVGIVAMQVEVLKLGASMGRAIDRTAVLQGRNESLRASVAALADDQRIERLAAAQGMVMPAPGDIGFLSAKVVDPGRAVGSVRAPNPSGFLALLSNNASVTQTPVPPGAQPSAGGSAVPTTGSATPTSTAPSSTGG